jgi:hypothetical protein
MRTVLVASVMVLFCGSAYGFSCSERVELCKNEIKTTTPSSVCVAAGRKCRANCKNGRGVYVGPVSGRTFPVDSCK